VSCAPLSRRERGRGEGIAAGKAWPITSERHEFARGLHKQQTRPEDALWQRLRGSRFHGAKFRGQVPFDRFVVDFYCHAAKLVVELDGQQHQWFSDYAAERSEVLEQLGVCVMRFSNEEVLGDLDSVLARIRAGLRLPFE
jgi:very-short-patch-repair endonuclease